MLRYSYGKTCKPPGQIFSIRRERESKCECFCKMSDVCQPGICQTIPFEFRIDSQITSSYHFSSLLMRISVSVWCKHKIINHFLKYVLVVKLHLDLFLRYVSAPIQNRHVTMLTKKYQLWEVSVISFPYQMSKKTK